MPLDLPPIEELRIHCEWFKVWYGVHWEQKVERIASFGRRHLTNRLTGNVKTDINTLNTLIEIKRQLMDNTPVQDSLFLPAVGKRCYDCRRELPIESFSKYRPDPLNPTAYHNRRCNTCRAKRLERTPHTLSKKALIDEAKGKPCVDCGRTFPPEAVDLDHVRGEKKFLVSAAWRWASVEKLKEELGKCETVCACCHRIRSKARGQSRGRPPRTAYLDLADVAPSQPSADIAPHEPTV